jgi:hypothetical protein
MRHKKIATTTTTSTGFLQRSRMLRIMPQMLRIRQVMHSRKKPLLAAILGACRTLRQTFLPPSTVCPRQKERPHDS